jgi:phage FluMu gp28-like protein
MRPGKFSIAYLQGFGLLSYQVEWLRDSSRFKIGLWSRQTGKDFTCAAEAVLDCQTRDRTHWLIIGAGERQARESLAKAIEWAWRVHSWLGSKIGFDQALKFQVRGREIEFANGSRITALPAKPGTLRGYSANIILTEFAFHDDPETLWRAVFPILTNSLRGGEKKLRIITTPNGQGTFFERLCQDPIFKKQVVTIHDAKAAGLPVDIEVLRRGIGDPDAFAQEYECEFRDANSALLPYELIENCETSDATQSSTVEELSRCPGELVAGIDFGRKHDLTVCWMLERRGAQLWTREVLVLKRMSTPDQMDHLRERARLARRVCVDATGAGVGLGDLLAREFGGKVELCAFTSGLKQEIFPKLRAALERGVIKLPVSRVIREDLHGIQRVVSAQGQISYRANRSPDGHSDRCTALGLALRAADNAPAASVPRVVGEGFRSRW